MLPNTPSKRLGYALALWLSATGSGFLLLGAYQASPGSPGAVSATWPAGVPIALDPARPTLLIFLHPRCPCSEASVAELASVLASLGDRFAAHVVVYRPEDGGKDWEPAKSWGLDGMPGLTRWGDPGGKLARRFGVETSGHVLLFEPGGALRFGGGITPARGLRGGNPGLADLVARLERPGGEAARRDVFGCPILDPNPASPEETPR